MHAKSIMVDVVVNHPHHRSSNTDSRVRTDTIRLPHRSNRRRGGSSSSSSSSSSSTGNSVASPTDRTSLDSPLRLQQRCGWRHVFALLFLLYNSFFTSGKYSTSCCCHCFSPPSSFFLNNMLMLRHLKSQTRRSSQQQILRTSLVSPFPTTTTATLNLSNNNAAARDHRRTQHYVSTSSGTINEKNMDTPELQFHDTPLGKDGMHLLDGLDHYMVYAKDDGHPLLVYGIQSEHLHSQNNPMDTTATTRKPILLLHGRTWSSVPVYHLLGGPNIKQQGSHESRSLMEALLAKGLQPYCMDFRGFGGTHMDATQCVEPYKCVQDAETVLQWIQQRHSTTTTNTDINDDDDDDNNNNNNNHNICNDETAIPALLGWSQGALVAQLVAQRNFHQHSITTSSSLAKPLLSKLILYGSIYDPLVRYPREPLYVSTNHTLSSTTTSRQQLNTYDAAIEDFTVEGTIPPEPARLFAEAALLSDPVKVVWKNLYQFNNCDPARVHVPCLVIAGDQDPYAPLHVQQELFCNLARASDRTWSILSGSDHACHLLDGRDRLINTVVSFVMNGKRTEPRF